MACECPGGRRAVIIPDGNTLPLPYPLPDLSLMQIFTEDNFTGEMPDHPWAAQFTTLGYADGAISSIPHEFFRDWRDQEAQNGSFYIGRCSGFGVGSLVKYDAGVQNLCVGRFVAGGLRLRFLLNGQHESKTISTYMFSILGMGIQNAPQPQYADSVIKNDVWLGDEVMMLGGGIVENGCIIGARSLLPPNFRSEPYGIYAGSPARLIRFRFPEKVCAALNELAWWEMPLSWIRDNNALFLQDMTSDESRALDIIARLAASRKELEAKVGKIS
ncbi:MAG: acetyltransferase [Massilia sp.]